MRVPIGEKWRLSDDSRTEEDFFDEIAAFQMPISLGHILTTTARVGRLSALADATALAVQTPELELPQNLKVRCNCPCRGVIPWQG
jgi:hypothetical protein